MRFNFNTLLFEELDKETDKFAICGSDKDISWNELYKDVESLCKRFKEQDIPKGHPIIIYGHKEQLFPVAMLACIRMQLPYVPIDRMMPLERVKKIKAITGSEVIINCGNSLPPDLDFEIVINSSFSVSRNTAASFKEILWYQDDPLIYIMFTSGSTGEPKGVMISTNAVKSFLKWMERDFGFSSKTVFVNQASFSFDISLFETYYTFISGATVVLNDIDITKNPDKFLRRIANYSCSGWVSTPSFIYLYLAEPLFNSTTLPVLKTFLLIGEILPSRTVKLLHEKFPGCIVLNSYGPTEATVATTLVNIDRSMVEKYSTGLPIGYSKYDGEILIENENQNNEEEGEIIIVGDHVAKGYLKNETLTKEKFFNYNGKRAYKTGDYGYCKDGMVFFNGRKDEQVKLNGYRIELGDITSKLIEMEFISDAVTIPLKTGGMVKRIVSFVTLKIKSTELKPDALRQKIMDKLGKQLPDYMIPTDIRIIDKFPTNLNHKIDKLKLMEIYTKS